MLTRETFVGPWAGLPVAWTSNDEFDEQTYRQDVARCCEAGIPGVYTGGTTGEFYAMDFDEFKAVSRATIEECRAAGTPCMIGCSSTYTLGAVRRAEFAASIGANAIQLALPFWMEVSNDQIVPFLHEVATAAGGKMPISIYDTTRAKKALTLDQHRAIKDAVPSYLMVKDTIGHTPEVCKTLSEFVNVFVSENLLASLGPYGASGSCSSVVYFNPRSMLRAWGDFKNENWGALEAWCTRCSALFAWLWALAQKGLMDSALDRLGGVAGGFLKTSLRCRGPYTSATVEDVKSLQAWYRDNFPEMLKL